LVFEDEDEQEDDEERKVKDSRNNLRNCLKCGRSSAVREAM
jgi:hypothetical protein